MTAADLRAIIVDVAELTLEDAQARAEQELSTLTVDDWTIGERTGGDDEDDEDVCALCGEAIDPAVGAVFPAARAQRRLGLHPGEAVCRRCARAYRARG